MLGIFGGINEDVTDKGKAQVRKIKD